MLVPIYYTDGKNTPLVLDKGETNFVINHIHYLVGQVDNSYIKVR